MHICTHRKLLPANQLSVICAPHAYPFFLLLFFFRCKNQIFCNLPNSLFRLPTPVSILISGAVFAVAHFTPGQFPQLFVLGKYLFFVKLIYVKAAE